MLAEEDADHGVTRKFLVAGPAVCAMLVVRVIRGQRDRNSAGP
jgi:hypothetical protein